MTGGRHVTCRHEDVGAGRPPSGADRATSGFEDPDRGQARVVGGKGAHLGVLTQIVGVRVPAWFSVTTAAYRRAVADAPTLRTLFDALASLEPGDTAPLLELTARIRRDIERIGVPNGLAGVIGAEVERLGGDFAYAVRSSATAEDLPSASFAGQHDTYLNVVGLPAILRAVSRCWASLFSERAVAYRMRNGIDHRRVEMAVVVQRMVLPQASGVLFTADPVTGNRNVAAIEATLGLGEALVSGAVDADAYRVRDGRIVQRAVAVKPTVTVPSPGGGTHIAPVGTARQAQPALVDEQVLALVALGRRIEADLGCPQDVEWCLDGEDIHVVQARPITTLFPVPETSEEGNRVYVSVGHQQMMTDPMTPLGLSVWQLTSPAPMRVAGGRLFVDVTGALSAPATRAGTLDALGRSDPRIRDALETVLERGDFIPTVADSVPGEIPTGGAGRPAPPEVDPSVVAELIERHRASVAEIQGEIRGMSGSALFEFILDDLEVLRALLFDPRSYQALMAGFEATWWLNDNLAEWLGEHDPSAVLSLAAPNNVTAEMGLALLDVADAIRPHPAVVEALRSMDGDEDLDRLAAIEGGELALDAIGAYLDAYGMRCIGEIDIARPRWSERPAALVPAILSNIAYLAPGERERRLEHGREQARQKAQELLARLRALPGGAEMAEQTERMIDRLRRFVGYREYPKYAMVSRYFLYRQALLAEAGRLVTDGVLRAAEDIHFLTLHELHEVARTGHAEHDLISRRREEFRSFGALTPPRVLTSEGEALHGAYRRDDVRAGALVGLAVSSGVVEGRARVVLDVAEADLEPGDILVTPHTDPAWSPLFVTVAGLVTEVGGLMTHGAVIAREYGLAAVVGVDRATERIRDGQRIRVDGTRGLVEPLPDP
jgi:rifampicin phosphotransferase